VFGVTFGEFATRLLVGTIVIGPKGCRRCTFMAGYLTARVRDWLSHIEDDPVLLALTMAALGAATVGLLGHAGQR
jgi:hypothetical protein